MVRRETTLLVAVSLVVTLLAGVGSVGAQPESPPTTAGDAAELDGPTETDVTCAVIRVFEPGGGSHLEYVCTDPGGGEQYV